MQHRDRQREGPLGDQPPQPKPPMTAMQQYYGVTEEEMAAAQQRPIPNYLADLSTSSEIGV